MALTPNLAIMKAKLSDAEPDRYIPVALSKTARGKVKTKIKSAVMAVIGTTDVERRANLPQVRGCSRTS